MFATATPVVTDLSTYERKRLETMAGNRAVLEQLGLLNAATDLRACIKRVAAFMGVDASDETLVDLACERSSEAYMREKAHLFDENLTRRFRNEGVSGLLVGSGRTSPAAHS